MRCCDSLRKRFRTDFQHSARNVGFARVAVRTRCPGASWLNQVEGFFGILAKQSLSVTDYPSKRALREHLDQYMRHWNRSPTAFEWTKPAQAIIRSHRKMLDRLSTAVH